MYTEEEVKQLCEKAFAYYAYSGTANQPYNDEELEEAFEDWFKENKKK